MTSLVILVKSVALIIWCFLLPHFPFSICFFLCHFFPQWNRSKYFSLMILTLVSLLCQWNRSSLGDDLILPTRCPVYSKSILRQCRWFLFCLSGNVYQKMLVLAIVEGNMLAHWNGFTGWNPNLSREIAAAHLASWILQEICKHFECDSALGRTPERSSPFEQTCMTQMWHDSTLVMSFPKAP